MKRPSVGILRSLLFSLGMVIAAAAEAFDW
jgi:hypothetical protein